jgi:glycosyltransferase involved in cell wall biosynthesis
MKVLQVINSLILAGAEVLLADLVPCLRKRGVEVTVAVLKVLENNLEEQLHQSGVPFLPLSGSGIYSLRHIGPLARNFGGFDVVHAHLFPAQLWVALAAGRTRRPPLLVTTEHSPTNNRRKWWFYPIDRWLYRRYALIACNSQATATALADWVPEVANRIQVVSNGIVVERFSQAAAAERQDVLGTTNQVPLLVSVARLEPDKDHATLLRALARVPQAHLALVGDGELRPRLQAQARSLGIAGRVHFLGRRPDVPQLLKMSDVFVHSTHSDGFCLAALEAMAAGIPVIATSVPGLAEVVGNAGVLLPPGDDAALAVAISSLLASEGRRKELAAAGVARARQFAIESTAEAYIRFYESALAGVS